MKIETIVENLSAYLLTGMHHTTSEGRDEMCKIIRGKKKDRAPSFYNITIKKANDGRYYKIIKIDTNIGSRRGRVLCTVWYGTAGRACEFKKGNWINKYQAANLTNDTTVTVIGLENEDVGLPSFYNSDEYTNYHHGRFG